MPPTSRLSQTSLLLLLACPVHLPAAPEAAPKTHTLFMGADLTIFAKDGVSFPVRDVQDSAFVGFDGTRRIVASATDEKFRLKINDTLKLATTSAAVEKLVFDRSFTPERDPMTRFKEAARVGAYMASGADVAVAELRDGQSVAGLGESGVALADSPQSRGAALALQAEGNAMASQAEAAGQRALASGGMDVFSTVSNSTALNSELYDAVTVTFELSSPRPLAKPYLVLFMRYLEAKERPDTASTWVYAERLPDIGERPRKFTIRRGGFPPGYHIDSYHVHLYDGGTELATNVARKRVALTTDEAFDYSVIDYVISHRDQTKAAARSRAFWPDDLATRLVPDKLTRTLYAKVRKDGRVAGVFEDKDCARPVEDAELAALAPQLRFLPALEKGKPVEGIARLKLGASAD